MGDSMNYLVRKPDAGKPHVRFDGRGVETESMASYSGTSNRKGWSPPRLRLNFTAPLLDSTYTTRTTRWPMPLSQRRRKYSTSASSGTRPAHRRTAINRQPRWLRRCSRSLGPRLWPHLSPSTRKTQPRLRLFAGVIRGANPDDSTPYHGHLAHGLLALCFPPALPAENRIS